MSGSRLKSWLSVVCIAAACGCVACDGGDEMLADGGGGDGGDTPSDGGPRPDGGFGPDGSAPLDGGDIGPDGGLPPTTDGFSEWEPMPSTGELDETDLGSRIAYISGATGDDDTGVFYFWNGSEVVDAEGNTYGSDPFDPEGDIQPFATFARNEHLRSTVGEERVSDWVLFRRGESYPPTGRLPGVGRSREEPALVGAWGPVTEPRPRFDPNGESFWWQANGQLVVANVVVMSVEVDARGAAPDERGGAIGGFLGINDANLPPPGEPDIGRGPLGTAFKPRRAPRPAL